jgi:hypothetical protein
MGSASWLVCGGVAFLFAKIVPHGRPRRWWPELFVALIAAMLLGITATALDFGGWRELDLRAAAFALCGTVALVGAIRCVRLLRHKG